MLAGRVAYKGAPSVWVLICTRAKRQTRSALPSKWIIAKQVLASHNLLKCSLAACKRALRSMYKFQKCSIFFKIVLEPVLHHRGRQFTEKSVHYVNMVKFSSCSNHWALFECYRSVRCIIRVSFFVCMCVCVAIFDANALKLLLLSLAFRPSFFHMLFCFPPFHFIAKKNLGVWGGGLYIRQAYFKNRIFRQLV